jgi:transcriptional regulator with XRE-family HTH domain
MGADRNTPSKLERGVTNPQLDTLVAVAEALNVSLGEMIVAAETGGPIPDERDGGYGSAKGSTKYPRRPGPLRRVADRPRRRR